MRSARQAVVDWYMRRGVACRAENVVLTPGTSMAYLYILRLLVEPGQEILVPSPGYPLFDDLCVFAGVRMRYYQMRQDGGRWSLDLDELAFQCTSGTRAVMLVSPHNPLGYVFSSKELETVTALCRERGMALVFDEVFSEFAATGRTSAGPEAFPPPLARPHGAPLSICLNGLSKMLALPGLKLGWMLVDGDREFVRPFLEALEYTSDLFLPVSEPAQAMLAPLLDDADCIASRSAEEIARRRALVKTMLDVPVVASEGGVYVCVPLPDGLDEDTVVLSALDRGVLLHPGHFYRLPGHIVFTCVAASPVLEDAMRRIRGLCRR